MPQDPNPIPTPAAGPPILSDYLADETMVEIIQIFLEELPQRIAALEKCHAAGNKDEFGKLVHQLKGAGGGYGFSVITVSALALEKSLRASDDAWPAAVKVRFDEFTNILRRVHAGRGVSRHT
ncbi:MAG: Hpt domain-containing protein [Planctomycetes bacterium]|nr:Hpt domain-containing protein [Planctomycetota bacterium]